MSMFRAYHQGGNTATAAASAADPVGGTGRNGVVSVPGDLSLVYPHAAAAAAWNFNVFNRGNIVCTRHVHARLPLDSVLQTETRRYRCSVY